MSRAIAIAAAAMMLACGGDRVTITGADPPYAPLAGGTRVVLQGAGFGQVGDPVDVVIAGRQAVLATVIDDARVEVLVPPGDHPGDAEVVALIGAGGARADGILHYSTPPTIDGVTPPSTPYDVPSTRIYVTGTGFMDEGAGPAEVAVEGVMVSDLTVVDDQHLTFLVREGSPLTDPTLELSNNRGMAIRPRAFRYAPGHGPGLLLFSVTRAAGPPVIDVFALYYEPSGGAIEFIGWSSAIPPGVRYTAVARDEHDDYWAVDQLAQMGRIDLAHQRLDAPIQVQEAFPAMIRSGDTYYTITQNGLIGRFDPGTGFTLIGTVAGRCCGWYAIAFDGGVLYYVGQTSALGPSFLATLDPETGETESTIMLQGVDPLHIEEMRFLDGVLYAVSDEITLVTIDTTTGVVTPVLTGLSGYMAMEVYP